MLRFLMCGAVALVVAGCASVPVGVRKVGMARAYEQISASGLSTGRPGDQSVQVLHRYDLEALFELNPARAIAQLYSRACLERRRDILFALAELNYVNGERVRQAPLLARAGERGGQRLHPGDLSAERAARDSYLAGAVCAYFFLFGEFQEPPPGPFDRRFRVACDLYNRGLAAAFKDPETGDLEIREGPVPTALGPVRVRLNPAGAGGRGGLYSRFLAADDHVVRGLTARNRQSGMGVPIIAFPDPNSGRAETPFGFLPSKARVPATAFLRLEGGLADLAAGGLDCSIEVYSPFEATTVQVGGQVVPLECDLTVTLAYSLKESPFWEAELKQFFSGEPRVKTGAYLAQPYRPGRIPVVFVHGTASSPARWAEMLNTLQADPALRDRFQFWYFNYNTGNPIPYSAALLRSALDDLARSLDPAGTNDAFSRMVLVGHSQGGLLCRLMSAGSDSSFRASLLAKSAERLHLSPEDREALERCLVFQPFPRMKRVVYLATPHAGSYRINSLVVRLARRFVELPGSLAQLGRRLAAADHSGMPASLRGGIPNSVDQMRPGSPFVRSLEHLKPAPGLKAHSIIAVEDPAAGVLGRDGVVAYSSAHLEGVESELVVPCSHSCQDHPQAIQEVRRILLEHLREIPQTPTPRSKGLLP